MSMILIVLAVIGVLVLAIIGLFNSLVLWRNRVKNSWAQIDVQLKRRYDLIPNLVETCKKYMQHEQETLEKVTQARQQAINVNGDTAKQAQAENMLSQTLRSLFAVSENYPDLKANQNMLALQEELTATENKISFARQHYNDTVMTYNTKIQTFPAVVIAGMLSFKAEALFELENATERQAVKVAF